MPYLYPSVSFRTNVSENQIPFGNKKRNERQEYESISGWERKKRKRSFPGPVDVNKEGKERRTDGQEETTAFLSLTSLSSHGGVGREPRKRDEGRSGSRSREARGVVADVDLHDAPGGVRGVWITAPRKEEGSETRAPRRGLGAERARGQWGLVGRRLGRGRGKYQASHSPL